MNWIFTIFSCIIPIDEMVLKLVNSQAEFFTEFFKNSWIFFYKFTIHLLRTFETSILETDELSDILLLIKKCKTRKGLNRILSSIPIFNDIFDKSGWLELIEECKEEIIDEKSIKDLLSRYDPGHKRFKYGEI